MGHSPLSTQPAPADDGSADPLLQPIDGVSLEMYAIAAQEARVRGVQDEDGLAQVAAEVYGVSPSVARSAFAQWVDRMGQSMEVGRQLRHHMGY